MKNNKNTQKGNKEGIFLIDILECFSVKKNRCKDPEKQDNTGSFMIKGCAGENKSSKKEEEAIMRKVADED